MFNKKDFILAILSLFTFTVISIYITFPLVFNLGKMTTGLGDEIVISWIQNWVIHSLTTNPFSLFNANIYYPYENSLAFSDLFLTSSILSFIPLKIVGEPIATVNFTLISSLIMLGFFTYLLIYYLTRKFFPAILGGTFIVFSPATLDKVVHLQILAIQWVPLSIFFFIIFFKSFKTRYLILSLVFFLVQTYNSFLPGYFIIFSFLIFIIYLWFYKRRSLFRMLSKKNILTILISFLFLIPIILPYYKVSNEFKYKRDIREAIHFALQPQDLFYSNNYTRIGEYFAKLLPKEGIYKQGYIGFVFSIVALTAVVYFIKNFKKKNLVFNAFMSIAIFGLIMSFGPALHWNGYTIHKPFPILLPYGILYFIFPGFQGFRNSARWEMLFVLMIGVAGSLFLNKFLDKFSHKKRILVYLLFIIGVAAEFDFPMKFTQITQVKNFPKVYSWLAAAPKDTKIIEMPIYNWNIQPYVSSERMREYYSTIHFKKMVNGASGFSPPPWQNLAINLLANFPNDSSLKTLKELKIDYILVHKDEYDNLNNDKFVIMKKRIISGREIIDILLRNNSVEKVKEIESVYIFTFKK